MVKFGTELRVPFSQNPVVYGLLFAEMGNVWSSYGLMEKLELPRSGPFDLKEISWCWGKVFHADDWDVRF